MADGVQYAEKVKLGGAQGGDRSPFCSAPHPDNPEFHPEALDIGFHWCRRLRGHEGNHAAFTFTISEPEEWEAIYE